jgi:hypothetical protein
LVAPVKLVKNRLTVIAGWVLLSAISGYQTLPAPSRISQSAPYSSGTDKDLALIFWILRTGAANLNRPFDGLLRSNIFWPRTDGLAFSDSMLAIAPVFRLLSKLLGGREVAAYNLILFSSYLLGGLCTWRLARYFGIRNLYSILAASIFASLPFRSAQVTHLHLSCAWIVTCALLLACKWLETRQRRYAVALGFTLGVTWNISAYLSILAAMSLLVLGFIWLLRKSHRSPVTLALSVDGVLAAVFAIVLCLPTIGAYLAIQRGGWLIRPVEQIIRIRFLRIVPSTLYKTMGWSTIPAASPEALLPGFFALTLGVILVFLGARVWIGQRSPTKHRRRVAMREVQENSLTSNVGHQKVAKVPCSLEGSRLQIDQRRRQFFVPLTVVACVSGLFAVGPGHGLLSTFFLAARHTPGLLSVREPVRFVILPFLYVCIGIGLLAQNLCHQTGRISRTALAIAAVLIPAEVLYRPPVVRVFNNGEVTAPNRLLFTLPRGVVVEEPMPTDTAVLEEVTAWRQLRGMIDTDQRPLGTSGGLPPEATVPFHAARAFPSPGALSQLRALGVRYILLHGSAPVAPEGCADSYGGKEIDDLVQNLGTSPDVEEVRRAGRGAIVILKRGNPEGVDLGVRLAPTIRQGPACPIR